MYNKTANQSWKYIFILALFAGMIFVVVMYLLDSLTGVKGSSWVQLIIEGIIFTVFYGLLFYLVTEKLIPTLAKSVKPKLLEGEKVAIESLANLSNGFEKIGGKLFLTDKRLIFKSHKLNIHRKQINFEFGQISEVVKQKIAKISDNGVRVTTTDGKNFDFVVQDRDKWLEEFHKME